MSDLIRWGILGTARINRALIPAIRASTRNRLVAIASRTPARAKNYAKKWGIDQYYGSYQTLLDNPELMPFTFLYPTIYMPNWQSKLLNHINMYYAKNHLHFRRMKSMPSSLPPVKIMSSYLKVLCTVTIHRQKSSKAWLNPESLGISNILTDVFPLSLNILMIIAGRRNLGVAVFGIWAVTQ